MRTTSNGIGDTLLGEVTADLRDGRKQAMVNLPTRPAPRKLRGNLRSVSKRASIEHAVHVASLQGKLQETSVEPLLWVPAQR